MNFLILQLPAFILVVAILVVLTEGFAKSEPSPVKCWIGGIGVVVVLLLCIMAIFRLTDDIIKIEAYEMHKDK